MKYTGYVGTYTKGESKGIYTFTLDTDTKQLSTPLLAAELENPTYVAIHKEHAVLYAVAKQHTSGGVAAYTIDKKTGSLTLKIRQLTEGSSPCHVSVNQKNQSVITAHYHRGTVEAYPVENGQLQPAQSIIQHEGAGVNKERQEKPHVHFAGFTPDEKYVVTVDLGTDQLTTYRLEHGQLVECHSLSVRPGSGPRHITFHPNGQFAYILTEMSNEVITLSYDAESGRFEEIQYIHTLPSNFTENSQGSAIHITSDGRFVYAGNRGHDSIAIFSIDVDQGTLTLIDHVSTQGNWPRDFVLDPTEQFLIASNQESHNLVLFSRNEATGKLTLLPSEVAVPYPVCLKFL